MSRPRLIAACCLAAAIGLTTAGCGGGAPTPGVTARTVTIGVPGTGGEVGDAARALVRYVNSLGGVRGRKIRLLTGPVARTPAGADGVFAMFARPGAAPDRDSSYLTAHKVPDLFVASACPCWGDASAHPYTFGFAPSETVEGKILGHEVAQRFAGQKIGILYEDDEYGRSELSGVMSQLTAAGVVAREPYTAGTATLAPQVTNIKTLRATVLIDLTAPRDTALEQFTAATLGYAPQVVVTSEGLDPGSFGRLLAAASGGSMQGTRLIEGAITDAPLPAPGDLANPWVALFKRIHDLYEPSAPFDAASVYGMARAYTLVQALQAAGRKLTRPRVIAAIERRGAYWHGPGLVPLRYSHADHSGYAGAELGQVQAGELVLAGSPLVTTGAAGSPVTAYAGAQLPPPVRGLP